MGPIILVRHGQAESNISNLTGGWSQTALTDLGHHQAWLVAARLKRELAVLEPSSYCSDLRRAAQTAEIIAEETGLQIVPEEGFRECNNGIAAGKTHEEAEGFLVPPTRPLLDWRQYPGSETWREFYLRVSGCMERVTAEAEGPLLIVTHGGTIINVVAWWIRMPLDTLSDFSLRTYNTGITILVETDLGERAIERHNDVAHLQQDGMAAPFPIN
ncbi:histidine phosphatase family protein [Candidatus Bathyarchaeota archaeon]|nr:histidine phosphatase family protein [Candidatus Bathyarchaeota archaeon]